MNQTAGLALDRAITLVGQAMTTDAQETSEIEVVLIFSDGRKSGFVQFSMPDIILGKELDEIVERCIKPATAAMLEELRDGH